MKLTFLRSAPLGIAAVLFLSACVGPRAVDSVANDEAQEAIVVREVAIAPIAEPTLYSARVIDYDLPDLGITLPGRLVSLGAQAATYGLMRTSSNYRLTEALREHDFALSGELAQELAESMHAVGYRVVALTGEPIRVKRRFRDDRYLGEFPAELNDADAVLFAEPRFAGYQTIRRGEPYVPTLEVEIRVVHVSTRRVLYADTLRYGGVTPVRSSRDMPADPRVNVRSLSELVEGGSAARGLRVASEGIATLVAQNLQ